MPGTGIVTPDNPAGIVLVANGEADLPRGVNASVKDISKVINTLSSGGSLATSTTPGTVRLARAPDNPSDPVAANEVRTKNQAMLAISAVSPVTLLGRKWQGALGTNQTFYSSDTLDSIQSKVAALYGSAVPASNFLITSVTPKYVVAGLSGGSGDYILYHVSSQQSNYRLSDGKILFFNGSTGFWNIITALGGTLLKSNSSSDPTMNWPGGVTVTAGTGGFTGVAWRSEAISLYATQNLPVFKAVPGTSDFVMGLSSGSFGGDAGSRGTEAQILSRVDDIEYDLLSPSIGVRTLTATGAMLATDRDLTMIASTNQTLTLLTASQFVLGVVYYFTQIGAGVLTLSGTVYDTGGEVSSVTLTDGVTIGLKRYAKADNSAGLKIVAQVT